MLQRSLERSKKRMKIINKQKKGDNNAYALYNALTHYATHIDTEKTRADLSLKAIRQEQTINTFVKGDAFKKLIRYDDFAMAA